MHLVSWESEKFKVKVLVLRLCGKLVPIMVILSPPRRFRPVAGSAPEIEHKTV